MMNRLRQVAVCAGVVVAALAAPGVANAQAPAITVSADPVEDVALQLTFAGTGGAAGVEAYATIKPVGGRACGASYQADDGDSILYGADLTQGAETINWTAVDSGDYLVCAWLQTYSSDTTATASQQRQFTVRAPRSTGVVTAPAAVGPKAVFQIAMTVQTEVWRDVFVGVNAPGIPCGANYQANSSMSTVFYAAENQGGPATFTENFTASETPGAYTICGYVQESSYDTVPEHTFQGGFTVAAPPSAACLAARKRVTRYTASSKRELAKAKKLRKGAKKARGARKRTLQRRAAAAQRTGTRARSSLRKAQRDVAKHCPAG